MITGSRGIATLALLPTVISLAQKLPGPILLVAGSVVALAAMVAGVCRIMRVSAQDFHNVGQGLFGFVSVIAIVVAGLLYFMERRFSPKLEVSVKSEAIRLSPVDAKQSVLLLKLIILVKNNGSQKVVVKCVSTGLSGLRRGAALTRDSSAYSDIRFESFPEKIPYEANPDPAEKATVADCLNRITRNGTRPNARPTFIWPRVALEPGETDDVYLEQAVSCDYSALRVLVKVRIEPDDAFGYETKSLVPLADLCAGKADPSRKESSPTVGGE